MSATPVILGLDLSLTHTGWAASGDPVLQIPVGSLKPKKLKGVERLAWFETELKELIWFHKPTLAVIENYAFGATNQLAQLGELGGICRLILHRNDVPFIEVAPTTLKKFVTGKGNSEKNAMMLQCYKLWNVEFSDNNEADAFALAKFGQCYSDPSGFKPWQVDVVREFKKKEVPA